MYVSVVRVYLQIWKEPKRGTEGKWLFKMEVQGGCVSPSLCQELAACVYDTEFCHWALGILLWTLWFLFLYTWETVTLSRTDQLHVIIGHKVCYLKQQHCDATVEFPTRASMQHWNTFSCWNEPWRFLNSHSLSLHSEFRCLLSHRTLQSQISVREGDEVSNKEEVVEEVEYSKVFSIFWTPGTHGFEKPSPTSSYYFITEGCNTALLLGNTNKLSWHYTWYLGGINKLYSSLAMKKSEAYP